MLWNGNECGKNKVMRISRQLFPVKIVFDDRPKTTRECGIF
jgi:hypothetical protein